jgi:hypothetical protein
MNHRCPCPSIGACLTVSALLIAVMAVTACQKDADGRADGDATADVTPDPADDDSGDVTPGDETPQPDVEGDPDADGDPLPVDVVDTLPPPNGAVIIDHSSVAMFDLIPEDFIEQAAAIPSLYIHASVGGTIGTGLDCLSGALDTRAFCESISDPKYDRSAWTWEPHAGSGCTGKLQDLVDAVPSNPDYVVYHQKFCYFEGLDELGSNCCGSPPDPDATTANFEAYAEAMNRLEAENPGKIFVWWTTPYVQGQGHVCANDWNTRMRIYARENGKVLYDIGDIETNSPDGVPTLVDGLEAAFPPYCGEDEGPSCHPTFPKEGSGPDGGNVRLAKAWWVMMALLAGWEP